MTTRFDRDNGRRLEMVLRAVESRRLTGTISVDGDEVHGTVAFRDGLVVGAAVAGQPDLADVHAALGRSDLSPEVLRELVVGDVVDHALDTLLAMPAGLVDRATGTASTPTVPARSTDEVLEAVARRRVVRELHDVRASGRARRPSAPPPPPPSRSRTPPAPVAVRPPVAPGAAEDHASDPARPAMTMVVQGPLPGEPGRPSSPPPDDARAGALRRLIDAVRGG